MQSLHEIRALLEAAGLSPRKQFGQNFLFDKNLMARILDLADLSGQETVLEVGPGTGSLTEELLDRARRVVAVEIDRGLGKQLAARLGERENFHLIQGDVLAGKHELSPEVLLYLGDNAHLVANLPYNIATPLIAICLMNSWKTARTGTGCRFGRLTFLVQREVAQRMVASAGQAAYGPISVIIALLGKAQLGVVAPAGAFWPRPKIDSQAVRIDFDENSLQTVREAERLSRLVGLLFGQRRKQIGSILRKHSADLSINGLADALERIGANPTDRAEQLTPQQFAALANAWGETA
jgi:16S rRNA (adenine1518-N6/adenine1519-N6)-dimethyltransferase